MEFIALQDIEKLNQSEQLKAKMDIIESHPLDEIPSGYLPPVHADEYYFVSYSHKDYKAVYRDIFLLQEEHLNIWYDRGIPAGKDWRDIANRFIAPFSCKGVLFYLSENALLSDAIRDEMEYTQTMGKPFIPILLPFENDYQYKGESVKGKTLPISEMIEVLRENGKKLPEERAEFLRSLFPSSVLYLRLDSPAMTKAEKIRISLPDVPVLRLSEPTEWQSYTLEGVNDVNAIIIDIDDMRKAHAEHYSSLSVGPSALANCRFLTHFGIPLFSIGAYGFYGCTSLQYVNMIGNAIGEGAFMGCSSLKEFPFNELTLSIPARCFARCSSLTRVKLDAMYIKEDAFDSCANLEEVYIGKSTVEIDPSAFDNCPKLRRFRVHEDNSEYALVNGMVVSKESGEIILVPTLLEEAKLDEPIQLVPANAFTHCVNLKKVTIGPSVTKIDTHAFCGCPIEEIVLPCNVELVGLEAFSGCAKLRYAEIDAIELYNGVFQNCPALTRVHIGPHAETLGLSLFAAEDYYAPIPVKELSIDSKNSHLQYVNGLLIDKDCNSVALCIDNGQESPQIPDGIMTIETRAFVGNPSIRSITLPDMVTRIDSCAFAGCSNLESVHFGKFLRIIENGAFDGTAIKEIHLPMGATLCDVGSLSGMAKLERVTVDPGNPSFASKEGIWYSKDFGDLVCCPAAYKGPLHLPNNLAILRPGCFAGCSNLTEINLPESVFWIRNSAFSGCAGLISFRVPPRANDLSDYTFTGCSSLKDIYLPAELTECSVKAFFSTESMRNFHVAKGNPRFQDIEGVLFDHTGTVLLSVPQGRTGVFVVPPQVTRIGEMAFACSACREIHIPSTVLYIGKQAFYHVKGTVFIDQLPDRIPMGFDEYYDDECPQPIQYRRRG